MTSPAGLVLAAGGSRRLGQPKQLLELDGEALLRRTVRIAVEAGCGRVVVVLGAGAEALRLQVAGLPAEVVVNAEWEQGMGGSIRAGLEALGLDAGRVDGGRADGGRADAGGVGGVRVDAGGFYAGRFDAFGRDVPSSVLILVCDQPRLTVGMVRALILDFGEAEGDITASSYKGVRGVPAIFGRNVFGALLGLTGDEGARKILSDVRWKVSAVEFAGGEVDIDLPSDLGLLQKEV
ncbi:MAG TPA: nucleotidyltransferase family protein [Acidisarcina sp.]